MPAPSVPKTASYQPITQDAPVPDPEPAAPAPVTSEPVILQSAAPASPAVQHAAPHDTLTLPVQAAPAPLSSAALPPASINTAEVGAPSIEGLGTLDDKNGGLGAGIWKGGTRESVHALLSWMHGGVTSPVLRDLTERLLLTSAAAPTGSGPEWFTDRVQALITMGSDDKGEQLLAVVPASMTSDPLEQLRAQLLLLHGDSAGACALSDKAMNGAATAQGEVSLWQKLAIFCKASAGKKDEALLALDLLRESNAHDDAFLQDVVHRLSDKTYAIKALPNRWTLFDVAIIRLAGDSDKLKDRTELLPPVTLKYLAADTTLDPKTRDKAESRAMQLGIIPLRGSAKATPPQPFTRPLASDVTTLVASLGGDGAATEADNAVIARLALDENAAALDTRRVQRLLTLMEPFGYRISAETWNKLFIRRNRYDGEAPPAILVDKLNRAAQNSSKGEVILLCALVLGGADIDKTSELVLLPVVKALSMTGFTRQARTIAHDAVQSYSAY